MLIEIVYVLFLMYSWFETDFFIQYSRLLGMSEKFKINDWERWREKYPRVGYLDYLSTRHRNFFTKLVSCKQCICFWFSILVCHFGTSLINVPIVYLGSIFMYNFYVWILWKLRKF